MSLTHKDAELVLKLYELRREPVMRESRNTIITKFMPRSLADVEAVFTPTHECNLAFRQTSSYWEMVYGFAKHGIIDGNFLIESNGEGLFLFGKMEPYLATLREKFSPLMFKNAEWIATQTEEGKRRFALIKKRIAEMQEQASK